MIKSFRQENWKSYYKDSWEDRFRCKASNSSRASCFIENPDGEAFTYRMLSQGTQALHGCRLATELISEKRENQASKLTLTPIPISAKQSYGSEKQFYSLRWSQSCGEIEV